MVEMNKENKPKPQFYSVVFSSLQEIAKEHGYNLVVHGSMNRDLDLIAIPWIDNPSSHLTVLQHMSKYLGAKEYEYIEQYGYSKLPGGRDSYIINLDRRSKETNFKIDNEYYLDISFTPLI